MVTWPGFFPGPEAPNAEGAGIPLSASNSLSMVSTGIPQCGCGAWPACGRRRMSATRRACDCAMPGRNWESVAISTPEGASFL